MNKSEFVIKKYTDLIFLLFVFILLLIFKYDYLSLPFFWEEQPNGIRAILRHGLYETLTNAQHNISFKDHPPIMFVFLTAVYSLFSNSIFAIRLFMLVLSSLLVFNVYKITEHYSNKLNGVLAGLSFIAVPIIFFQTTQIRFDLFTAVVGSFFLFSYIKKNFKSFIVFGFILALSRETSFVFYIAVFIDLIMQRKLSKKYFIAFVSFAFVFSLYFIRNYFQTGQFVTAQVVSDIRIDTTIYFDNIVFWLKWLFVSEGRFLLLTAFLLGMRKYKDNVKINIFLLIPVLLLMILLSIHIFRNEYYYSSVLFLLYIVGFISISFSKFKKYMAILLFIGLLYFNGESHVTLLHSDKSPDTNNHYSKVVNIFKESIDYMYNLKYGDNKILVAWPLSTYLTKPIYGFVPGYNPNVKFLDQNHLSPSKFRNNSEYKYDCRDHEQTEYIAYSKPGDDGKNKLLKYIIRNCNYSEIKRFTTGFFYVKIFKKIKIW